MNTTKKVLGKALLSTLKNIKKKKKDKILIESLDLQDEVDKVNDKVEKEKASVEALSNRFYNEGDVITLKRKELDNQNSPNSGKENIMLALSQGGLSALQDANSADPHEYEVWLIRAINSTHLLLERITNITKQLDRVTMVLREDYNLYFADDFVEKEPKRKGNNNDFSSSSGLSTYESADGTTYQINWEMDN